MHFSCHWPLLYFKIKSKVFVWRKSRLHNLELNEPNGVPCYWLKILITSGNSSNESFLRFPHWLLPSDASEIHTLSVNISTFTVVLGNRSVRPWVRLRGLLSSKIQQQAPYKMKSLVASVLVFAFCISVGKV